MYKTPNEPTQQFQIQLNDLLNSIPYGNIRIGIEQDSTLLAICNRLIPITSKNIKSLLNKDL